MVDVLFLPMPGLINPTGINALVVCVQPLVRWSTAPCAVSEGTNPMV